MRFKFLSENWTWVSGGTKTVPLEFLDRAGPRGGRMVIEKILLEATLNLTTTSTQSMTGPDQASFVKQVYIRDNVGERRRLTGFELRQHAAYESVALADPAALPVSQTNQPRTFCHVIPFRFDYARRGYDYSLPVDDIIQGGIIQVQMPANSDLLATGVPTIVSGSYQCVFYCREEFDVEAKARDRVLGVPSQGSDTFLYVAIGGDLIRSMLLTKEEAGPTGTFTNLTDVTVDNVKGYQRIPRAFLTREYALDRPTFMTGFTTAMDGVFNNAAVPIFNVGDDAKIPDFLRFGGQAVLRLTSTVTSPKVILHTVAPKEERIIASTNVLNELPADTGYVVKLQGGARSALRDPRNWGALAAYLPAKAARVHDQRS